MSNDELNTSNELYIDFNNSNIDILLENISSEDSISEDIDMHDDNFQGMIDEAIQKLEKALNIVAVSDDDLAELYASETELHEDIEVLDFDRDF